MNKTITKEEFAYDYRTMTNRAMAKKYNVGTATIYLRAKKLGLNKMETMVGRKLTIV